MFCYQCQESFKNTGCTRGGVCGKTAKTADIQDELIAVTKGLALAAEKKGIVPNEVADLLRDNLFRTITNANFDDEKLLAAIAETKARMKEIYGEGAEDLIPTPGVLAEEDENLRSLKELITYGLKGFAAYGRHAAVLGKTSEENDAFLVKALAELTREHTVEELLGLTMETGEAGVRAMALLDEANTSRYGHPEITQVSLKPGNRPGILVSGHDLRDLEELLEQSKDAGVDIYTHSEMLPANAYPALKAYSHLKGNYGSSWHRQREEFEAFHGPILMTTNCIVPPKDSYKDRLFTTGVAAYPGCPVVEEDASGKKDFSRLIEVAKSCEAPEVLEEGSMPIGFAHNQVLALADKVVEAVKSGAVRGFAVMAGCDGRQGERSYYTDFAKALPEDVIILTAGCAKYRYNKLGLGDIGGIPRVLDAGQCNDSYSLVRTALALKDVFGLEDINDLPIIYNIAWYEQKAVIVLLALLSLGVKNIHLGPTLPAFLSPAVATTLVDLFGIAPNTTVKEDMEIFFPAS